MDKGYRQIIEEVLAEQGDNTLLQQVHGGGLDKKGGHTNRKTNKYHMHRDKKGRRVPRPSTVKRRTTEQDNAPGNAISAGRPEVPQNQPRGSDLQFPQEAASTSGGTNDLLNIIKKLSPEQQKALIQQFLTGK